MNVAVLTLAEWQALSDYLSAKGLEWFKVDRDSKVDPGSTSRTADGKFVVNLSKIEKVDFLKSAVDWPGYKNQIRSRISELKQVAIDREFTQSKQIKL